jgi:DNA repair photolyase
MKKELIKKIEAKSILRKHKKVDSWFISEYGMNLYRGCTHNCIYCDGRAEGYYVDGEFGKDITVKINAIEVLRRELMRKRKRSIFEGGFIMLGGGVGDSYQPVEKKYKLTRRSLQLMSEHNLPVHVLTKSTLVKRDIDILKRINRQKRAIVSFSISSVDDRTSAIFEPGVPSPNERLETLAFFKKEGIACGIFLLPVIPFITDTSEMIEASMRKAHEIGVDFVIFGGMTLKQGRQQDYFLKVLKKHYPKLCPQYQAIYRGNKWGNATDAYYRSIDRKFDTIASTYKIAKRIPSVLFSDILSENDLVMVILEQIDYLLMLKGLKSPYGYAAYTISKTDEPLSTMKQNLRTLKGIGGTTERIINEILETKTSVYYERLLKE